MTTHLTAIDQFVRAHPDRCAHVVDMPYRLCSPAAQIPDNVHIWHDSHGQMVGFGILQWQFATLDWATAIRDTGLKREIFTWALTRLREARIQRAAFGFLIGTDQAQDLEAQAVGFTHDDWVMCHLALPLSRSIPAPEIPSDITISPLNGVAEVEAYVTVHRAAFDSRAMSVEWRLRTLTHPTYQSALDLVAHDNQGHVAAFCIGWSAVVNGIKLGQIEPLGVRPDSQRQGIGRAILLTALRRMRALGCETATIDAESNNPASTHLYAAIGFREYKRSYQYFRWFE